MHRVGNPLALVHRDYGGRGAPDREHGKDDPLVRAEDRLAGLPGVPGLGLAANARDPVDLKSPARLVLGPWKGVSAIVGVLVLVWDHSGRVGVGFIVDLALDATNPTGDSLLSGTAAMTGFRKA